ncbi:hypothetical protein D9758_001550 [Tetrapyrgos nigripes]|uniref:L-dopachrome isomerase n=1 Tax=Tetrapyrgos nigripes TaxID=182062 RepID=A0A8H5LX65_9AGAR|nr:hypothetical protein D9758_001550 [Tetrapyrgos nigripes]
MPIVDFKTNVKIPNVEEYVKDLSKLSATLLGYPEEIICVSVLHDQPMSFKGTFDPTFLLSITLTESTPDNNSKLSAAYFEHFKKTLGIDDDRGYISFLDPGKSNLGFKGKTVEQLLSAPAEKGSMADLAKED